MFDSLMVPICKQFPNLKSRRLQALRRHIVSFQRLWVSSSIAFVVFSNHGFINLNELRLFSLTMCFSRFAFRFFSLIFRFHDC